MGDAVANQRVATAFCLSLVQECRAKQKVETIDVTGYDGELYAE